MSKAGPRLLRSTLLRSAEVARHLDPQLAHLYYVQVVERGACHLKALCVVAAHLGERAWTVLSRGTPYEFRDIDGTLVTPPEAKALAAHWRVPDEVRQRRRSRKTGKQAGNGKAPHQVHQRPATRARSAHTRRPSPQPILTSDLTPHQAGTDRTPRANRCSLLTSPSYLGNQLNFTVMHVGHRRGPGRRPSARPADPLQPTTISKGFPTALVEAGLPRLRFHDLRHSSASFLLHMGIPPLEVARILGHSSVTTTMTIYAHAIDDQTSPRAAQVMNAALRRIDIKDEQGDQPLSSNTSQ